MDFTKLLIQANESEEKEDTVNLKERKLSIMSHKVLITKNTSKPPPH